MSCYHPNLMVDLGERTNEGKIRYKMMGRADHVPTQMETDVGAIMVPCRKCYGCRMDYARVWTDRMLLELVANNYKAIFLTLTYDNEHVPVGMSDSERNYYTLDGKDVTDYFKRLRYYFPHNRIRFYLAAEYGGRTHRPHYHTIIFGIDYQDIKDAYGDVVVQRYNRQRQPLFTSPGFASIWGKGFILFAPVNANTCAYVARYVQKKAYGSAKIDAYAKYNCIPEFSRMSRRPGIGMSYFKENPEALLDKSCVWLYDGTGTKQVFVPSKFYELLQEGYPDEYKRIKAMRAEAARNAFVLELSQSGLNFCDYLTMKEGQFKRRTSSLHRNFEEEMEV